LVSKKRSGASVNVYLVLKKEGKILLSLRQNTGYCDGFYGLVAGHVEDGESAIAAMIREAEEEAGISILPKELALIHLMHRKTDRFNVDMFFECSVWKGDFVNKEPLKCRQLDFYPANQLPENLIPYIQKALEKAYSHKQGYSEEGWTCP
jgi:8-oxo-dGTP diphosphatase